MAASASRWVILAVDSPSSRATVGLVCERAGGADPIVVLDPARASTYPDAISAKWARDRLTRFLPGWQLTVSTADAAAVPKPWKTAHPHKETAPWD